MTKCGRCIREASWRDPDHIMKVYCSKHVPKRKTVIPLLPDDQQTRLG